MIALLYLVTMLTLGGCVSGRIYSFQSRLHYFAVSFLVGLVLSTWVTYLFALLFARSAEPLLVANLLFFAVAGVLIYKLRLKPVLKPRLASFRPPGSAVWDALFVVLLSIVGCYLMFGTLWLAKGNVCMAFVVWNDFGPNLSLMQSFAMGHNFPTEYPHFIGEPIRH